MKKQPQDDPWSQLVSDLGLEDGGAEKKPEPTAPEEPVECSCSESVPDAVDETAVEAVAEKTGEGKKTFFGRFPKINLFGNPSKDTLDAVVEGSKTPSLSGKSFTSKTLEKVPVSQKREPAEPKAPKSESKEAPKEVDPPKPVRPVVVDPSDPWSQIASQVGILSVAETRETIETTTVVETMAPEKDSRQDRPSGRADRKRGRRTSPSMFDDAPPRESEESRALKNLIEDESDSGDEAARRLRSLFDEDDRDVSDRLEDQPPKPEAQEEKRSETRGTRRRGRREDRGREPNRSETTENTTPGRRGSRYVRNEEPDEADNDQASTWDIEEEVQPVERSSRGRRRRDRSERNDSEISSDEASEVAQLHRNIPSWDEAIALIIDGNVAKRNQRSSESRRGRR